MAKYPATKILNKATPRIRTSDNVVISWNIEVVFSYDKSDGTKFTRTYHHIEDVEFLNKLVTDFTKTELLGYIPIVLDEVFDTHCDSFNLPPIEQILINFNVNTLVS